MEAEEKGEEFPWGAGEDGTPVRRWGSVLLRVLVGGALVLALAAGALRATGALAMRIAARRMEERFGGFESGRVETSGSDALVFHALLELKRSGTFNPWPDGDRLPEPALVAATDAYRSAARISVLLPGPALEQAVADVLHRPEPLPEAWTLLETWLPSWEPGLNLLDAGAQDVRSAPGPGANCADERELNAFSPWLGAIAVLEAHRGDSARALARLDHAFRLARASGAEPPVAFANRAVRLLDALAALQQVMRFVPPETDLSELRQEVESLDAVAELRGASLEEWRETYALYRASNWSDLIVRPLLVGICLPDEDIDERPIALHGKRALLWPLLVEHDAARYTHLSEASLASLAGTPTQALEASERRHSGPAPWYAPAADWLAPLVGTGVQACVDLESAVRLARIGLLDRESGREAALELAARTLDPATGEPIQQREERDGSLTLWCVGSDRVDMDGDPLLDDLAWMLPPPR